MLLALDCKNNPLEKQDFYSVFKFYQKKKSVKNVKCR